MRTLFLINLALVLGAGPAIAKDTEASPVSRRFLKVEASTWDWYGIILRKDGQKVGPEFFGVIPDSAVKGSADGERHAQEARVFQGFTVGLALAGFGLGVGAAAVRQSDHRWSGAPTLLGASGIAALLVGVVCALGRDREAIEAVSAYNYDLVNGTLGE